MRAAAPMRAAADLRLDGKVALLTGAAGGQGIAHAHLLHALGARLVLTDLDVPAVATLAAELGDGVVVCRHDVTLAADWASAVELADREFGRLDVLISNAGIAPVGGLIDAAEDTIRNVIATNLLGPLLGIRAAAPAMRDGGSIINISSTAGLRGFAERVPYTASKFGLRGATRAAARELGAHGIRVNAICPGSIDTPMASASARAGVGVILDQPIPRIGRPEEVSAMVAYLASDLSLWCTGQDFVIDGGQVA